MKMHTFGTEASIHVPIISTEDVVRPDFGSQHVKSIHDVEIGAVYLLHVENRPSLGVIAIARRIDLETPGGPFIFFDFYEWSTVGGSPLQILQSSGRVREGRIPAQLIGLVKDGSGLWPIHRWLEALPRERLPENTD